MHDTIALLTLYVETGLLLVHTVTLLVLVRRR
jgi:hypothetical protein